MKTTSLKQFINEGLIKLPPKMLEGMIQFCAFWYVNAVEKEILDDSGDKQELADCKKWAYEARRTYHLRMPTDAEMEKAAAMNNDDKSKSLRFKIEADDMPKEYVAKILKKYKMTEDEFFAVLKNKYVQLFVYAKSPSILGTARAHYNPTGQQIVISADKFYNRQNNVRYKFEFALDKFIGTLEHELTHAIQHILLSHLHLSQVHSVQGDKDHSYDDYLSSGIEFDPWIKNSIAEVKSIVRIIAKTRADEHITPKEVILHYTGIKKSDRMNMKASNFFTSLKKTDLTKWKKACKLLSVAVLGEES